MRKKVLVAGFATRHVVQSAQGAAYEVYAVDHFCDQDLALYAREDSKNDSPNGMTWSREAEQRLDNIPDFIRPTARKEIEQITKKHGLTTITAQVMDETQDKFMKFM